MSTIVPVARVKPEAVVMPKTLLSNGGFEVWERGTSFTPGVSEVFTADEWANYAQVGLVTFAQETSNQKFGSSCMKITTAATTGPSQLRQGIESYKDLEGRWVTFSAWVKTSTADHARLRISDKTSAGENNSFSQRHTGSGDWEFLTATRQIRTGLTTEALWPHEYGMIAGIYLEVASSEVLVDGAMFVEGYYPEGVPFVPLNVAEDLDRCLRYFEKGATPSWTGLFIDCVNNSIHDANSTDTFRWKAKKAAAPTVTISNFITANTLRGAHGFTTTPSDANFIYYMTDDPGAATSQAWCRYRFTFEGEVA